MGAGRNGDPSLFSLPTDASVASTGISSGLQAGSPASSEAVMQPTHLMSDSAVVFELETVDSTLDSASSASAEHSRGRWLDRACSPGCLTRRPARSAWSES